MIRICCKCHRMIYMRHMEKFYSSRTSGFICAPCAVDTICVAPRKRGRLTRIIDFLLRRIP